jgi:tetratricopeptide (TPR) repeat protein
LHLGWPVLALGTLAGLGYLALSRGVFDTLVFRDGDFRRALWWVELHSWLWGKDSAREFRVYLAEYTGRTSDAVEFAEALASGPCSAHHLNIAVNAFINAGKYRRALEVGEADQPPRNSLVQLNLAEAEYNLGQWEAALERLDVARQLNNPVSPVVAAGETAQRAWILGHLGRVAEADSAVETVNPMALPHIFRSEFFYTRSLIALASGDAKTALMRADEGLAIAKRASSVRNGVFLRARALAMGGDCTGALREFEGGASHTYQGQGGAALLEWGDLLLKAGREDEARKAWASAVEKDPESESAVKASERLETGAPEQVTRGLP